MITCVQYAAYCCRPPKSLHLNPLLPVDLDSIGPERGDRSVNDLLHHLSVAIGFLQLGGSDPDVTVSGNVFTSFVQHPPGVLIGLQSGEGQPKLKSEQEKKNWVK